MKCDDLNAMLEEKLTVTGRMHDCAWRCASE